MASKLERDFPWLAPYVLARDAYDPSVKAVEHEQAIEDCLVRMLQAEYRKNAVFAAFLQSAKPALARDVMKVWMRHAFPQAFERVTGQDALANNVYTP